MISIITPVFNRRDLTAKYLFGNNVHYPNDMGIEWIIIDNGSTDGTGGVLEYWKDIIGPRLKVIKNEENKGFAVACNQGAQRAKGDTLLFLNNDIIINGDYVTPLEKALKHNPHSLAGPQLANFDTGWNKFGDLLISYLVGWCLAIPAAIFAYLGGFDEQYSPAYYEDMDLCYNALKRGYDLQQVWVPVQHLGEQTGLTQLKDREEITKANRAKFAQKWGLKCT